MYKTFLLLVLIISGFATSAQQNTIKGQVKDKDMTAVIAANILLYKSDSTLLKGSITDAEGNFEIGAAPGDYFLTVSMLGFEKMQTAKFTLGATEIKILQEIIISQAPDTLKETTVTATKKLFEMQADKMVMNVENSVLATGNSVFEVLRKAPAVTTDKDDNIKLKGLISQILIDGKPAYLSGQALTDYLKNLPADAVSKIEIITNPSSKYDAAGAAGIINIRLKKNKAYGLNGTANIGGGFGKYGKINGGTNLNFRKNKVNIFGSAYGGYSESYNQLDYNSRIDNHGEVTLQDRDNYWNPKNTSASYKAGMDYNISSKSTIGILYRGGSDGTNSHTDNNSTFRGTAHNLLNYVTSTKDDRIRLYNNVLNVNYSIALDTAGNTWSVDADYARYSISGKDVNENHFYNPSSEEYRSPYIFRNTQPAETVVKAFKSDYTGFLPRKFKLETGLKFSKVKSDSELISDSLSNNNWQNDGSRSNHFIYNENIIAAYATLSKTFNKTSIQAGLRAEHTDSKGYSITLNKTDKRNYLDFFPTLFISQELNSSNQLNFSYTRRIDRAGYLSLNPFVMYIDPYTYFQGNPYLKPSYSNSFELKHSYKDLLFTALSYKHSTDVQTQVIRQNKATGVTANTSENADYSDYIRLDITASIPVTKWWSSDNNVGLAYNKDYSTIPEFSYDTRAISAEFSSSHTFSLPGNYKVQTAFYYGIPTRSGIARILSWYEWDLGLQKELWNNRATIKVNATNIIGPSAYRAHYLSDNLDIVWKNKWEGKKLMLSFVYKFGSNSVKGSRNRNTASQQEQNRI
jgi:hypothetical protein